MRFRLPASLALATLAVACDLNPFGGNPLGEYDLVSIDGDPLPAAFVVLPESNQTQVEILSSRVVLESDHTGEETVRQRSPDGSGTTTFELTNPLTFEIDGSTIKITYDCPDNASCIAGPHLAGQISDAGIVFDVALGRTPLVYRKR